MSTSLLTADLELLKRFERHLDPQHPERGPVPAHVLGYGEISTVFELGEDGDLAYKRMPIFRSQDELRAYERIYVEYHRLLSEEVGLELPPFGHASLTTDTGLIVFYGLQRRLDPESIGNRLIHRLATPDVHRLVRQVLRELAKVWRYNRRQSHIEIGIDGQISNWAVSGLDRYGIKLGAEISLCYLDTSTPLYRVDGQEQLNGELFLRSAPSFLAWLLRWLFLEDVINRYYDFHRVVVDLIANFYKEQLADLVPGLVELADDFFANEANDLQVAPVTLQEVRSYYREDAMIWRLYQSFRRIDRFLHTRILHREYPYILPEIAHR